MIATKLPFETGSDGECILITNSHGPKDDHSTHAGNFHFVARNTKLFRQPHRLAVSVLENFGCRHDTNCIYFDALGKASSGRLNVEKHGYAIGTKLQRESVTHAKGTCQ